MFTTSQLAEATNLAPQTILNYVKEGIIAPDEITPDGRYYFNEDLVFGLLLKKSSMLLRNASLTIVFGSTQEELQAFEERYRYGLSRKDAIRVDDILSHIKLIKDTLQKDAIQQTACLRICVEETMKEYDKAIEGLKKKLQGKLLTDENIADIGRILPHREVLFEGSHKFMEEIDQRDKMHINGYMSDYRIGRDRLRAKYCMKDINGIAVRLDNADAESVDWEPETGTVKGIFRKAQQKHFRLAVDMQIRKNLTNGYFSLLGVLSYESESIYRLLKKAVSSEYSLIEVFGYERASSELQDVIKFLQETKKVTIYEQDLSTIIGGE